MFSFIPPEFYFSVYINVCFFLVILVIIHSYLMPLDDWKNIFFINFSGYLLFIAIVLYLGFRPLSRKIFGDMMTYADHFKHYAEGGDVVLKKDVFFQYFMKYSSSFLTLSQFFLLCAALYIVPMYVVSKRYFKEYWFYAFLIFIVSFQFWPYATNGIRNGISTSFFLMGIAYYDRKFLLVPCFVLATLVHNSALLPILAFSISFVYNKPKVYLYGWLVAIPLSIVFGGFFESLLVSSGLGDDRLETYLTGEAAQNTGFRYDFLLYSCSAVFTGWYFIFKKKFKDRIYINLFNTYLITNAFWIMVIRANFSNRFAYLSWFMIGLIIIYPFLKERFYKRQYVNIAWVVVGYFSFTYFMTYIYYAFIK